MNLKKIILSAMAISLIGILSVSYVNAQTLSSGMSNVTLSKSVLPLSFDSGNKTNLVPISKESIIIQSNKNVYQYGETINLTINDMNYGSKLDISTFKNNYAGIRGPCGIQYFDFAFLRGNYGNITNYDQLAKINSTKLDVIYASPNNFVHCIRGIVSKINQVEVDSNNNTATIKMTTSHGNFITTGNLITNYQISKIFGRTLYKQISANTTLEYKESELIPPGNYTIITFNLSGKIGKPLLLEIKNETNTKNIAYSSYADKTVISLTDLIKSNFGSVSLFSIPIMLGVMISYNKKYSLKFSNIATLILVAMLSFNMITTVNPSEAALYNVINTQGIEAHSTTTSFTQATVETEFQGVVTDPGANNGLSVQNNQFVNGQSIGANYLWVQSVPLMETLVTTTNSHICTTQDSNSFTCKLPTQVQVNGNWNYWTAKSLGNCPSGWTPVSNDCYLAPTLGQWTTVNLSSNQRIDLYAYQEIRQSTSSIYVEQDYRTCTGPTTDTCTGYNLLGSDTKPYGTTFSYYFPSTNTGFQGTFYGVESVVGECSPGCNSNGRVNFYPGTFGTLTYTLNGNGSPFVQHSPQNQAVLPAETNNNIIWWDAIGGSYPTFTDTFEYGVPCNIPSSGVWDVQSSCVLTSNQIAPDNVIVENGVLLTVQSGVQLTIDFSHHYLKVMPGGGVLITNGGKISS